MAYKHLFSPVKLDQLEVKNRLAMAPMGTDLAHPVRLWGDEEIAYFAERAKGGVGLIIPRLRRQRRCYQISCAAVLLWRSMTMIRFPATDA